jgi:hypothetical protein
VDPVALSYILAATGPVATSQGITLNAGNAVDVLLRGAYTIYAKPAQQDSFFAEATGRVFAAVTQGSANKSALIQALERSTGEDRIHLWSSHSTEEAKLSGLSIAGAIPPDTKLHSAFGVYFNDATGAKMDYYLHSSIGIAAGVCRNDRRPTFEVQVKLYSTLATDAVASLPAYVSGGGVYDVTPGNVRTNIFVYAPAGSVPYSVTINSQEYAFVAAEHDGHSVAGVTVEIGPDSSAAVSVKFVGIKGDSTAVTLQHTPMSSPVATSLDNSLDCSKVKTTPNPSKSGASPAFPAQQVDSAVNF